MRSVVSLCCAALLILAPFFGVSAHAEDDKDKDKEKPKPPAPIDYKKKLKDAEDAYLKVRNEVVKELRDNEKAAQAALDLANTDLRNAKDNESRKKAFEAQRIALDALNKARNARYEIDRPKMIGSTPQIVARPEIGGRLGAKYNGRLDTTLRTQLDLDKSTGQLITEVIKDRPADKAGLKVHDVLVKLDGKDVPSDPLAFAKVLAGIKVDEAVDAIVIRQGKQLTVKITLPAVLEQVIEPRGVILLKRQYVQPRIAPQCRKCY